MYRILARDYDGKMYGIVTEEYFTEETGKAKFKEDTGKEIKEIRILPMTL